MFLLLELKAHKNRDWINCGNKIAIIARLYSPLLLKVRKMEGATAGAWIWLWVLWLSLSVLLLGGMLSLPPKDVVTPLPARLPPWVLRFVQGEMAVGGTVRIGLGLGGAGWWCGAAGLLVSDLSRSLLVVGAGALVLIALFNAGRRGAQSLVGLVVLSGFQGAGWVVLLLIVLQLYGLSVR
ncbi:hypothetical protein ACTVKF_13600 [Serratia marcescens]|uniref:hypothetical protein n=1 Tax=Serratia marcescens TaxID=615 RepID=UPI003FA7C35C